MKTPNNVVRNRVVNTVVFTTLAIGYIVAVVAFGLSLRGGSEHNEEVAECIMATAAELGPGPGLKDFCDASVTTGQWHKYNAEKGIAR